MRFNHPVPSLRDGENNHHHHTIQPPYAVPPGRVGMRGVKPNRWLKPPATLHIPSGEKCKTFPAVYRRYGEKCKTSPPRIVGTGKNALEGHQSIAGGFNHRSGFQPHSPESWRDDTIEDNHHAIQPPCAVPPGRGGVGGVKPNRWLKPPAILPIPSGEKCKTSPPRIAGTGKNALEGHQIIAGGLVT